MQKNVKFEWTADCQQSFERLKIEPTLLQYPDFGKEFCIITEASKQAFGAV